MHSARQTNHDRNMSGRAPRVPPINRTLVWFHGEAEQRRRSAAAAQEALRRRAVTAFGSVGPNDVSYADIRRRAQARRAAYLTTMCRRIVASLKALPTRRRAPNLSGVAGGMSTRGATVWQRPELFGCVALAALLLSMIEGPSFNSMGPAQCRTEPGVLAFGADMNATMTVSHNAACAIWTKTGNLSISDVKIAVPPQHGTLVLRGRTGVTYRPAGQFTGNDFFAFALSGRSDARDKMSLVRVGVTVK